MPLTARERPQCTSLPVGSVPPLCHAIGGSLGSVLALLLCYPLERARTELQAKAAEWKDILLMEQISSSSSSCSSSSSDSWETTSNSPHSECVDPGPIEPSSTTIKNEAITTNENLLSCLLRLHQQKDLYRGVGPVITTLAISNFVFFYAHEQMKRLLQQTMLQALLASSLAGIINVILTNPLWVANIRIVKGPTTTTSTSLLAEMRHIRQTEGLATLWNGTWASLVLVSNPVIQFFVYEQLKRRSLQYQHQQRNTSPKIAFLLGAIAKGVATVLTYPLQLAQVLLRLQHSGTSTNYKGTIDCLVKIYNQQGIQTLFTGMKAKLLQTVLTSAFTFLTYEEIMRAVRIALFPSIATTGRITST